VAQEHGADDEFITLIMGNFRFCGEASGGDAEVLGRLWRRSSSFWPGCSTTIYGAPMPMDRQILGFQACAPPGFTVACDYVSMGSEQGRKRILTPES
jgi:hypothetical protein